ncbi:uncharacterized protein LOC129250223 [Anastrepha obliqua]|uniref:uncharacterized protein LOC129250223 n=1 Tax=Anastrepha obliqua TaxID=95512 RepID=UPI002409628F|nr:uncharacterized protein LOC129250223 [Anastrepha obliqua]
MYRAAVALVGEVWEGAKPKVVDRKDLPVRPRARVWLPSEPFASKELEEIPCYCNPTLPTHNWRVVKVEKTEGSYRQVLIPLNAESLSPLAEAKGVINYGFEKVVLNVYQTDARGDAPAHPDVLGDVMRTVEEAPVDMEGESVMSEGDNADDSKISQLKALVKDKLVSLKIDVATRMDKSILGVNLQLIDASLYTTEIVVKTLGMIQLADSHAGVYIKQKILKILMDYEIKVEQIFNITSENGRNMIKAVQVLNDATEESPFNDDTSTQGETIMEELDTIDLANIHLVRCAAYTLQLCVIDVNKVNEINDKICSCHTLCKMLRTETNRLKLPHLSALAQVILATPATQVSAERAFSALHFILSERRSSISAENPNALLVVKLNSI